MKFEIMLSILFELLSKRTVTSKNLSEKYGVSQRSIYRYIEGLESAGVPIYTVRGNGGGFSIVDTYKLSSTFMTVSEFNQTIDALNAINESMPNKDLEKVILKLKSNIKNEYSGFDIKSGNLIIDGGPWGDTIGYKSKLAIIQKSLDENNKLLITYHDRNGSVTDRTINPHFIVFKQGIWYVYAYCNLRNEFRFFKTGRIEKAIILNEKFIREDISRNDLPLDYWHLSTEAKEVVMKIDQKNLSDIEEWLGVENVKLENNEYIARAKLPFDDGLVSKIMSYGKSIEVLYPVELKEKIKTSAQELLSIY